MLKLRLLIACLVPLIAAGGGGKPSLQRVVVLANLLYACFGVLPGCVHGTEVLSFTWWATFGGCGLLALSNIHQLLGVNPAEFPYFMRDEVWIFSS